MHAVTNIVPKADGRATPWNRGKFIGQKPLLNLKENWTIRAIVMQKKRLDSILGSFIAGQV